MRQQLLKLLLYATTTTISPPLSNGAWPCVNLVRKCLRGRPLVEVRAERRCRETVQVCTLLLLLLLLLLLVVVVVVVVLYCIPCPQKDGTQQESPVAEHRRSRLDNIALSLSLYIYAAFKSICVNYSAS